MINKILPTAPTPKLNKKLVAKLMNPINVNIENLTRKCIQMGKVGILQQSLPHI